MNDIIPEDILKTHTAVLGMTGSGKTSTGKLLIEHVVAQGARVCVLDPIKSDWWGMISSADGRKPGLPFHVLGGPHGHVPLHSSAGAAIGELVATGALPLSIIDMADFEAGGLQRFFVDFSETLFKKIRGVLYLVIEEAHEFAPKERAGIGNENMAIHWAKKLATGARSKGLRLIVATQRTQSLHNALLGSCPTMIVHQLTAPADQDPVLKFLKANVKKEERAPIEGSLSSLGVGEAWICSSSGGVIRRVKFPRIKTFDNSATPEDNSHAPEVVSAQVDRDKLRAIIGDAVKDAEANDPATLKAEIARLKKQVAGQPSPEPALDPREIANAEERGRQAGKKIGFSEGWNAAVGKMQATLAELPQADAQPEVERAPKTEERPAPSPARSATPSKKAEPGSDGLHPAAAKMLTALAGYTDTRLTWQEVCVVSGVKHGNGHFYGGRKSLNDEGLVDETSEGVRLTREGAEKAGTGRRLTRDEIVGVWLPKLKAPAPAMLAYLTKQSDRFVSTEELANAIGTKPGNGHWYGGIAVIRDNYLVEQTNEGVRITRVLREASA